MLAVCSNNTKNATAPLMYSEIRQAEDVWTSLSDRPLALFSTCANCFIKNTGRRANCSNNGSTALCATPATAPPKAPAGSVIVPSTA